MLSLSQLFAAESFSSKFWKSWVDEDAATDINATPDHNKQPQDYITFYELPFPYEQLPSSPHREGSKTMNDRNRDRESGKVVVPVTLTTSSKTSYGSASHFGLPFMLGMKREEATSFEAVHEALARQIARLSRRGAEFFEVNESASGPDETADSAANSTDPATATKKAGDFSPPTLPPVGTPVVKKGFKILVNSKSDRRKIVPLGSSNSTVSANLVSLRERIKGDAEPMPGSLPGNEASMDETDDELKKRYEDATPPEPVIETGDTIVVEFSEASHKYFFGDDNHLYNHDQTQVIGKPPAPSQKRSSVSLDACLDEFSKTEQLDAMNTWYCPACKDHKEATKQVSLWSLPDILVIHLKRFSGELVVLFCEPPHGDYSDSSLRLASRYGSRQKITDLVDFPQEGLDLAPRVIERQLANRIAKLEGPTVVQENTLDDTESMTYDLYAVDNHYGGMGGGHCQSFFYDVPQMAYSPIDTAYARNALDNRWYDFDDVKQFSLQSKSNG